MKYTIEVNQLGADKASLRGKVDIIDLAIFSAFKDFANGTKCEKKMTPDGRVWFWISYGLIIDELPYCNIKSKDGIYRRMKNLQAAGVIDFHPDNQKENKTFFAWGQAYDLLISDTTTPVDLRMKNRRGTDEKPEGYGLKTGGGTDEKPDNHYTIDNYTNHNTKEGGKNAQNAFSPPFHHVGSIEIPNSNIPLNAEKKANDFTGAGPGAEFIVTTHTPQAPYIRVVEKVEIRDAPGPKSPTTTPGRRSQAAPTIHPENLQAFDHFSDPEKCRALWSEWIEYKWGQHRDKYKTPQSELVMLRKLYTWSHGQAEIVSQIIEKSVGNLYKGLIDPNEKKGNGTEKRHDLNPAQRQHLTLAQYVAQRRIDAENRDAMG